MRTFLMVLLLAFITFLLSMPACSSVKPAIEDSVGLFAQSLGAALECNRADLMEVDLRNYLLGNPTESRGSISETVCPIVVPLGLAFAADRIPAKYECKAENAKEKAGKVITDLCKKIPL